MLNNGLRGLAKSAYATGMHWCRLDKFIGARRGLKGAPLVVGYHRVVRNFEKSQRLSISPMLVSEATLEQHLHWIGRHYRFVSADEMVALMKEEQRTGTRNPGKPAALVTFDDGYQDVYQNALPILKRLDIPAAVFVVTDLVGTDRLLLHDELYLLLSGIIAGNPALKLAFLKDVANSNLSGAAELVTPLTRTLDTDTDPYHATRLLLGRLPQSQLNQMIQLLRQRVSLNEEKARQFQILTWDELRDWVAAGMTVGSHTRSHALLAKETPDVIQDEVEGSRLELERQLKVPVRHFVYPDGSYDSNVLKAIAGSGYRAAYTVCNHRHPDYPMLSIPRRLLWENACMDVFGRFSSANLSCQVNGLFDHVNQCRRPH